VRTTLVLNDDLVQQARHLAVDSELTLSELVNRALRAMLTEAAFGPTDRTVHHEPADFARCAELEDEQALG
jgi:hypothetical protein